MIIFSLLSILVADNLWSAMWLTMISIILNSAFGLPTIYILFFIRLSGLDVAGSAATFPDDKNPSRI